MDACGSSVVLTVVAGFVGILSGVLFFAVRSPHYNDQSDAAVRSRKLVAWIAAAVTASLLVNAAVNHSDCNANLPREEQLPLFPMFHLAVIFSLLSISQVAEFFLRLRNRRLVENLPTSKCRSVAMGLVEVAGRAAGEETILSASGLPAYFSCVQLESSTETVEGKQWNPIARDEVKSVPFFVEDATGRVRVSPAGAELRVENVLSYSAETGLVAGDAAGARIRKAGMTLEQVRGCIEHYYQELSSPERMARSLEGTTVSPALKAMAIATAAAVHEANKKQKPPMLRVREFVLGPGDPVYVLGTAAEHPGESEGDRIVITKGPHHPWFVIASGSQRETLLRLTEGAGWLLTRGIIFGLLAAMLFVWSLRLA